MEKTDQLLNTPIIPDRVYTNLPSLIKSGTDQFDDPREKDVVLLATLVTLSASFSGIQGKYGRDWVGPNLFGFVVAPASSGKGSAKYPRMLGQEIQNKLLAENKRLNAEYRSQLEKWESRSDETSTESTVDSGSPPEKPKNPVLFIPGNSSAASIFDLIHEGGSGLIYETEADTLSGSLKQDWGGFSDTLRKVFHHEPISKSRKTDGENKEVLNPRLSVFLTGTPDQVSRLINSAEDGLFSRFLFYVYRKEMEWQSQEPCDVCPDTSKVFLELGKDVEQFTNWLKNGECTFSLTPNQFRQLNAFFKSKIERIKQFDSEGAASSTYRLSLICFRIAMILSVCRQVTPERTDRKIFCNDVDFQTALNLVDVYFEHMMVMLEMLPKGVKPGIDPKLSRFHAVLPDETPFFRSLADSIGKEMGISERTVGTYLDRLVTLGLLSKIGHGRYQKIESIKPK